MELIKKIKPENITKRNKYTHTPATHTHIVYINNEKTGSQGERSLVENVSACAPLGERPLGEGREE